MGRIIGMDLHPESIYAVIADLPAGEAECVEFAIDEKALQAFENQLRPDDRIAIEATTNAYYFHDRWQPLVAEVAVANPVKLRPWLGDADKSDRYDAAWLAILLNFGCLPQIHVPGPQTRDDRDVVALYSTLMNELTRTKNGIRSFLTKKGLANPASDLQKKDARDLVVRQCALLGESAMVILNSKLAALDSVEARLEAIRPLVTQRAAARPEAALLLTAPGIELTIVLTMMATIDTLDRFPRPASLVKYAGLVPREKSSAGKTHRGRGKRTGSRALRWAATQGALSAIKQPGPLKDLYRRLVRKGHGVAICACARKLLTIVWHMLTKNEPYRETPPNSKKRKEARVKRKVARAKESLPERRVVLENLLKHAPQLKELAGVRHGLPLSLRPVSWRGPAKSPAPTGNGQ